MQIEELFKAVIAALHENTAAVKQLESTLVGRAAKAPKGHAAEVAEGIADAEAGNLVSIEEVEAKQKAKFAERKAKVEEIADQAGREIAEAVAAEAAGEDHEAIPGTTEPVAYETVRKLVLALAPTQRDAIKAINARHGIVNLKVLLDKEDDYSTVNDQTKLEAVYADLLDLEA